MDHIPIKILLIEDNPGDARPIRQMLVDVGMAESVSPMFELIHAERLSTGLAHFNGRHIDIILLDLSLPDSQGLATFTRAQAHAPGVPIIVLTGLDDETLAVQTVQVGAQDYLVKGQMDGQLLMRAIRYALERHQLRGALQQKSLALQSSELRLRTIIEQNADGLVVVDQAGLVRFVNPAAESLFGRRKEELLDKDFGFPVVAGETMELEIIRPGGPTTVVAMRVVETEWGGEIACLASLHDITERKRVEEMLQESEARFRGLVETATDAIITIDAKGRIRFVNQAAEHIFRYAAEEIIGQDIGVLIPEEYRESHKAAIRRYLETGQPTVIGKTAEMKGLRKGGEVFPLELSLSKVRVDGEVTFTGIIRDITEHKQAEQALQESEERYRTLAEAAQDMIFIINREDKVAYANSFAAKQFGFSAGDLIGKPRQALFPPDTSDRQKASLQTVFERAEPLYAEERHSFPGVEMWLGTSLVPLKNEVGEVYAALGIARDITARKQVEEALRESEERFRQVITSISDHIYMTEVMEDGRYLNRYISPNVEILTGYPPEKFMADRNFWPSALIQPDDRAAAAAHSAELTMGRGGEIEYRLVRADGQVIWVRDSGRVEDKRTSKIIYGVVSDITERKRTEERVRQSAARTEALAGVAARLSAQLDLDMVLNTVCEETARALNVPAAIIALYDEKREMFDYAADFGLPPEFRQRAQPMPRSAYDEYTQEMGQMKVVPDMQALPNLTNADLYAALNICSGVSVSMLRHGQPVGGLIIFSIGEVRHFTDDERALLKGLADQAGLAIANARLYDEARRRNRELELLNRVIATSDASLEPESILEMVCHDLALAFDLPQAAAAMLNQEKTEAVVVAEYFLTRPTVTEHRLAEGRPSGLNERIPVKDNPLFQYLFSHKGPLVVEDAQSDPRLAPIHNLMRRYGVVSLLILPLIIGDEVVGSLGLEAVEPRHFSPEEVSLAWSVADQVAAALSQSRLRKVRRLQSTAIEQAAESMIITDNMGTILYVNPAFEQITGYSRAEAIGQNPRLLKSGKQDTPFYDELWATISAGQVWQGRFVNQRKDGTLYTDEATITSVKEENGAIVNYVGVQRDVTRELQLEEQYHQAQKMDAIGQLTGGIAHDFNNLLTAINGFAELLQMRLPPDNPQQRLVSNILSSGQRAADLIRQLLAFSRKQIIERKVLDLNIVVANMDQLLQRVIGEHIDLETVLSPDLGLVKVDPTQIEQVIVNLAVNARDAMPEGGRLTIETANVVLDEAYVADHLEAQPGPHVLLAVSDTGIGMSSKDQAHIFEPFFTTKAQGKGTGLGLATVFGIVKQSGGNIWVYSEEGQGTTFKIYLPGAEQAAQPLTSGEARVALPTGSETILLVEDDAGVRELARQVLQDQGYTVLEAQDGQEALPLTTGHAGPIHLLLTDVVMPGMSGKVLAEKLAETRSGLRTLFMSGYTDKAVAHHEVLDAGVSFLQKPFSPIALARKVREVLDG